MRYPFIISDLYSRMLLPGPAPQPSAAPSDARDNPHWNSDDKRDFQDQQYSPPSPMSHYPGSLNPIKSGFPTGILVGILFHALCLVAPYPFRLEPLADFDPLTDFDMTGGDDVWFARPQLFFSCSLCPTGQMEDKASHVEVSLVFFSTFEPISLTPDSCRQWDRQQAF